MSLRALSDTLILDRHWYGSLAVGAGDGASYLPRYRIDGFIHRKWLDDLSLVTSIGMGHYRAPDAHKDDHLSLGPDSGGRPCARPAHGNAPCLCW